MTDGEAQYGPNAARVQDVIDRAIVLTEADARLLVAQMRRWSVDREGFHDALLAVVQRAAALGLSRELVRSEDAARAAAPRGTPVHLWDAAAEVAAHAAEVAALDGDLEREHRDVLWSPWQAMLDAETRSVEPDVAGRPADARDDPAPAPRDAASVG
jgi:hypothetical protein